jgi:hypothetical protein
MLLSDFIKTGNTRKTRTQARTQTRTQVRQQPRVQTRTQTREEPRVQARTQARTQNRTQVPARAVSQQVKKAAERFNQLKLNVNNAKKQLDVVREQSKMAVRRASERNSEKVRAQYAIRISAADSRFHNALHDFGSFMDERHPGEVYAYANETWVEPG